MFLKKEDSHALKMSERPTQIKPPTAKLTDVNNVNNTEPLALSSHHDSVAARARARAQAAESTPSINTSSDVNDVDPTSAPINQPVPSVPASLDIEPPVSNKRPSRATVMDEEEDSAVGLSDMAPAKSKKHIVDVDIDSGEAFGQGESFSWDELLADDGDNDKMPVN